MTSPRLHQLGPIESDSLNSSADTYLNNTRLILSPKHEINAIVQDKTQSMWAFTSRGSIHVPDRDVLINVVMFASNDVRFPANDFIMPGTSRWIPRDDRLGWFKRLNRQYLTPLGLATRDLVRNFVYKMRSRRRKRAGYTTHYTYTTRRFTCTVNTESSDGEDSAFEEPPEPPSKLSPFAATAVPHSPKMYMADTPGKVLPWPSSPRSFSPGPMYQECSHSYSSEIAPRWPSPQPPDHCDPPPTNHIRAWNRYSRRLELCLPTPEPRPESPDSMMLLQRNIAYSTGSQASTRPPSTATCASKNLRRLPSIESGFGPAFGLNQFRREWLRVSQFEPGTYRQSICSDTLESIPEDQLIDSQTSDDNPAPASGHRTRSSMASSAWSPRNSARYIAYRR